MKGSPIGWIPVACYERFLRHGVQAFPRYPFLVLVLVYSLHTSPVLADERCIAKADYQRLGVFEYDGVVGPCRRQTEDMDRMSILVMDVGVELI